jgi:hypothetical protein
MWRCVVVLAFIAGCGGHPTEDADCVTGDGRDLIATVPGKNGTALVIQTNGGATTAFGANICVEAHGRRRLVAVGYESEDVEVAWLSPTVLAIDHLSATALRRTVDITTGVIVCEPVRTDWRFCEPDGTQRRTHF